VECRTGSFAGDATKKAMAQITAPIIAIRWCAVVLCRCFIREFGTLLRQFAVKISAAMVIRR